MKKLLVSVDHGLDCIPLENIGEVSDIANQVRQCALACIDSIDESSENNRNRIRAVPLELMDMDDVVGALWFVRKLGQSGDIGYWKTIEKISLWAIERRQECIIRNDKEFFQTISLKLDSLFQMLRDHPIYRDLPDLSLLLGDYEKSNGRRVEANACYDSAIHFHEYAFCKDNSQENIFQILNSAIRAERWDRAQMYIEHAYTQGFDIKNHSIALYLGRGELKQALQQTIGLIHSNKNHTVDLPIPLQVSLSSVMEGILRGKEVYLEENDIELKILASFLFSSIIHVDVPMTPHVILNHWHYLISICVSYEGAGLHERLIDLLEPLVGYLDRDVISDTAAERVVELLQAHAVHTYNILGQIFETLGVNTPEELENMLVITDRLCTMICSLLQRLPKTDAFVIGWKNILNFHSKKYPIGSSRRVIQ